MIGLKTLRPSAAVEAPFAMPEAPAAALTPARL
jgi:hypothetical protein